MARKPNGQDRQPEVVDLRRYRQAAAKRKAPAPPPPRNPGRRPGQGEPFLGPRPNAGLILVLVVVVLLALWLLPALL
ncbi:MAG: hypothetical protein WCY15_10805 [Phenylobacterium sp.]|jgi:hypothetical protein